jgi:hypothetical protein
LRRKGLKGHKGRNGLTEEKIALKNINFDLSIRPLVPFEPFTPLVPFKPFLPLIIDKNPVVLHPNKFEREKGR